MMFPSAAEVSIQCYLLEDKVIVCMAFVVSKVIAHV